MCTLPQYAAFVNPVLPVCYVIDLRKQHRERASASRWTAVSSASTPAPRCCWPGGSALVAGVLAEARQGRPPPAAPARWAGASLAVAARNGLAGAAVDPFTGRPAGARALLSSLPGHVQAALSARGDAGHIATLVRRLDHLGTGAGRQRALFAVAGSMPGFVQALARATLSSDERQPSARSGRPPGRVAARTG